MIKKLIVVVFFVFVGLMFFSYLVIKPEISAFSVLSLEKCGNLQTDDCWHALAHQTLNSTYCNKIQDNETKEHCLEHLPS